MITRYLLSTKWRKKIVSEWRDGTLHKGWSDWIYTHIIDWNPTSYLLREINNEKEQHVLLNSHQLTNQEYELLSADMRFEDFTRDD